MGRIEVKDLDFIYETMENTGKKQMALQNVNCSIEEGEFICIIGHSGCGKSTLLKLFAGLLAPSNGAIYLDGKKLEGPGTDRAVVFQDYSLFPWMKVQKNVAFGIRQAKKHISKKEADRIALEYLKKVNMEKEKDQYPAALSGGMRQRVAIARALAMDADILLLDEPFGALDPKIRMELQDLLLQLREKSEQKKTVIFITHDVEEAILLADRILFMEPGKITMQTNVPFARPRVREEMRQTQEYADFQEKLMQMYYQGEE